MRLTRVYANGNVIIEKQNYDFALEWMRNNIQNRPGCALLINGRLVHKGCGYHTEESLKQYERSEREKIDNSIVDVIYSILEDKFLPGINSNNIKDAIQLCLDFAKPTINEHNYTTSGCNNRCLICGGEAGGHGYQDQKKEFSLTDHGWSYNLKMDEWKKFNYIITKHQNNYFLYRDPDIFIASDYNPEIISNYVDSLK